MVSINRNLEKFGLFFLFFPLCLSFPTVINLYSKKTFARLNPLIYRHIQRGF